MNLSLLKRNTKFIAESLAKHIYGLENKDIEVFTGSLEVNENSIQSWMNALTSESRATPLIVPSSTILRGIENVFPSVFVDYISQNAGARNVCGSCIKSNISIS